MRRKWKLMVSSLACAAVLALSPGQFMAETAPTVEELESEMAVLESEKTELETRIAELESENTELKKQLEELEPETETELSTEVVGLSYTDKSVIQLVQSTLNGKGYDCGTPDGVAGNKTESAIKNYEKDNKLNVNGVVTDELLESLGIADKIEEAARIEAAKAEYSTDYTYEQLARNPDAYYGDKVTFKGKVLQAETGDVNYMRLAVNDDYDTIIFVTYDNDLLDYRLLEDDMVVIYGLCSSTYSYEAVSGATITLPWIYAEIIELQ